MKKTKLGLINLWKQIFKSRRISTRIKELILVERRKLIIEQLFFELSTDESLELFRKVQVQFKFKMETRSDEALAVHTAITNYYGVV